MVSNPWLKQVKELGEIALSKTSDLFGDGVGYLQSVLGDVKLFASTETSDVYRNNLVDEKHYFLIPDHNSEMQYSLYIMRCLPKGVPPINALPKHRILHLSNDRAYPTLEKILTNQARSETEEKGKRNNFISDNLNGLIDEIDKVDGKVFNGVLLIGGLVALINPLAGAAVAMKAMIPSVGLLMSKYGLKFASETITNADLARRIQKAEQEVLKQFESTDTIQLINPLLAQVETALHPEIDNEKTHQRARFECQDRALEPEDIERFLELTYQSVCNLYQDVIDKRFTQAEKKLPLEEKYKTLLKALII